MLNSSLVLRNLAPVAIALAASVLPATAAPPAGMTGPSLASTSIVTTAQGIYFGYGRPYRGYGGYYGPGPSYGGYYRPYYPPPPPPVTYYESRPYAARPPESRHGGDPDAVARCASRFKSFNVHTGTYVTYDGEERLCPYLR